MNRANAEDNSSALPSAARDGAPARRASDAVRIVLVDDSDLTRERAASLLGALDGVEVVGQAIDIPTGMALLERLKPDVLLLDIELAGRSGLELLETLDARKDLSLVKIMLTSYDHPKLRERCAELGAHFYFHKLTEFEMMVCVCKQLAEDKRRGIAASPAAPLE